jgi:hypothetical protein
VTTTIRISKSGARVNSGGLAGAFGGTAPGESIDVEFMTEAATTASDAAGWIEELATVAAAALRQADTGEIVTSFVGETDEVPTGLYVGQVFEGSIKPGTLPNGAVVIDKDSDPWKVVDETTSLDSYPPYTLVYLPPVAAETEV